MSWDLRIYEVLDYNTAVLFEGFDEELEGLRAVDVADSVSSFGFDVGWFVGEDYSAFGCCGVGVVVACAWVGSAHA